MTAAVQLAGAQVVGRRISVQAYSDLAAVNWTSLKPALVSMLHYKAALEEPREDTDALRFGRIVHCAVFEPLEFPRRYVVVNALDEDPRANRGKKPGKTAWKQWQADHPGKELSSDEWKRHLLAEQNPGKEFLTEADYDRALAMGDALRRNTHAAKYLAVAGAPEVAIQWTDPETKLPCKARLDWLIDAPLTDCDLKTARSIRYHAFSSQAWKLGYFHQLVFHRMGLQELTGRNPALRILAVENVPPFDAAVFEPDEDSLYAAGEEVREVLVKVARARREGRGAVYAGQYDEEQSLRAPGWAWPDEDATDDLMFGQGGE